jgi:uncharacterized membrane protein YdbT with pleckstrin-like domain
MSLRQVGVVCCGGFAIILDKVESVQVDQSILGRMLDYGTVTILGTGEGFETLRTIAGPIKLRNCITGT